MGYQVGEHCFATKMDAAMLQRWTLGNGSTMAINGAAHVVLYEPTNGGDTVMHRIIRVSDGVMISEVPLTYQPTECQVLGVEDGIAMGWMVGGALIGAFCLMFLARALRGETGESYGAG